MIDPPWPEPGIPYPSMSLEQIRALELPLAEQAVVLLWTMQRFLPAAFGVLEAWGLRYLRTKMWPKPGRGAHSGSEFLLLAARGDPPIKISLDDVIRGRVREHSRKPDEAYRMAEQLLPNARRLDMYGRESRTGWTVWGAEATKYDPPQTRMAAPTRHA